MLISDAIPVQFWLNGEPSFNELDEAGVDKICFYQPWNCDDEIVFQGLEDDEEKDEYSLLIKDLDDNILQTIPLDKETIQNPVVETTFDQNDISEAEEIGTGDSWDGNEVEIDVPDPNEYDSKMKIFPFNKPAQEISIEVDYTLEQTEGIIYDGIVRVALLDADKNIIDEDGLAVVPILEGTKSFTLESGEEIFYIGIYLSALTVGPMSSGKALFTIPEIRITETDQEFVHHIFSTSFKFSDYELCSGYYKFELVDGSDEISHYSNPLDIEDFHTDTRLISYTNELDFAGIQYDVDYPPTFHIRVKSKFYTPRNQQETESEPDAEGNVIKLSSSSKKQKQLVIDPVPPYMHDKLILILQHNSIYINNRSWVQEDNYEINEINERFGLFSGSVWLTQMDDNFYTNVG